jgi:hypothetical protein
VDSPPGAAAGGGLDIMTPLGTVVEVGTQFEVRYDERAGELGVRVREGAVSVRRNGQAATARRGESLAVRRDGSVSRAPSPVGGGSWEWILEAAPAIDVEGRTLDAFLAWAARETGLDVVFEDDELAAHAATIELSASLEGLRPDQAIDVVVRASGLEVARDGDRLLVARPH